MIVGFSLRHIEADTQEANQGNMNINYTHTVDSIEEADVPAFDETIARVTFTFNISYEQDHESVADINFEGTVLWQKNAEDLIEQWQDDETIDDTVNATLTNHIFRKCLTQAVGLADSLELPSPVPMPQVGGQ